MEPSRERDRGKEREHGGALHLRLKWPHLYQVLSRHLEELRKAIRRLREEGMERRLVAIIHIGVYTE
jgi:hypothetical protein